MSVPTSRRRAGYETIALGVVVSVLLIIVSASPIRWRGATPAAAQAASGQAPTSAAALVQHPGGFAQAFYRGQNGSVFSRTVRDGVWSAETSLGGKIIGAPAAARAGSTLVVAGRGGDSALFMRMNRNGTWGAWQSLGGALTSAPAVAGRPDGSLVVFGRGSDDQIWTRTMAPGGSLSGWIALPGVVAATGPAAVAVGADRVDVYVAGADHAVWRRTRSAAGWAAWQAIGGLTYSAPAASVSPQGTDAWVFVRGRDNALWLNAGGSASTRWQTLGGGLVDAPAAAGAAGRADVVGRGTDKALWLRQHRGGTWSAWSRAWAVAPPPAPAPALLGVDWTRVPTTAPRVALTFDAGANADAVPSILHTLKTKGVPGTFFLTGEFVRSFPAETNAIAVSGYLVGNHSDTHPDLTTLTDAQIVTEVQNAQRSILLTSGVETRPLFRFPFGAVDSRVLGTVNGLGYVGIRWTVDTLGWQGTSGGQSVQSVIDRVLAGLQPGEIVLMHVGSHPTDHSTLDANALPAVIDAIRARGYGFVTIGALTG